MAIKLGTYDENGNLTSTAMTGDKFKEEVENALDKRGDVMVDGTTLTLGKDPENNMDAVPKQYLEKYFDDFIYYLNNISPITLKRDSEGTLVISDWQDKDVNSFNLIPNGHTVNRVTIQSGSSLLYSSAYSFNINEYALGYKSPNRRIKIVLSQYCSKTVMYEGRAVNIYYEFSIKDEEGNIAYSNEGYIATAAGTNNIEYSTDSLQEGITYTVDVKVSVKASSTVFGDGISYSLGFHSLEEKACLRDVVTF